MTKISPLYYSVPPPYRDAKELAFWQARFVALDGRRPPEARLLPEAEAVPPTVTDNPLLQRAGAAPALQTLPSLRFSFSECCFLVFVGIGVVLDVLSTLPLVRELGTYWEWRRRERERRYLRF